VDSTGAILLLLLLLFRKAVVALPFLLLWFLCCVFVRFVCSFVYVYVTCVRFCVLVLVL
jgi:hypothetical protein